MVHVSPTPTSLQGKLPCTDARPGGPRRVQQRCQGAVEAASPALSRSPSRLTPPMQAVQPHLCAGRCPAGAPPGQAGRRRASRQRPNLHTAGRSHKEPLTAARPPQTKAARPGDTDVTDRKGSSQTPQPTEGQGMWLCQDRQQGTVHSPGRRWPARLLLTDQTRLPDSSVLGPTLTGSVASDLFPARYGTIEILGVSVRLCFRSMRPCPSAYAQECGRRCGQPTDSSARQQVSDEGSRASTETMHGDTGAPESHRPSTPGFQGELQREAATAAQATRPVPRSHGLRSKPRGVL